MAFSRAFGSCATMAADDKLRDEFVNPTGEMEVTAADIRHLNKKGESQRLRKFLLLRKMRTPKKWISTCRKMRREVEVLHDELKEKRNWQ